MGRYLVTGGCGFIGSHLVDTLLADGHSVRVLDNLSTGKRENLAPAAELLVGDIRDQAAVAEAFEGVDGCFHLAAESSVARCESDWLGAHAVNLTGTMMIFEQARRARSDRPVPVVYASSAAVYGDAATGPLSEEMPAHPINAYGTDKAACELYAELAARRYGLPVIGLRLFNVYGPRQDPASIYSGVISVFCARLSRNLSIDIYGDGGQTRDFIHVSDVVAYLERAMHSLSGGAGLYNVCTGESTSIRRLAETIADLTGVSLQIRFRPARQGDIRRSAGNPARAVKHFDYRARTKLETGLRSVLSGSAVSGMAARRELETMDNHSNGGRNAGIQP